MKGIRSCLKEDLPDVAVLHERAFQYASGLSTAALTTYLEAVFFGNPWYDPATPSLLYEEDGKIIGFLGVVPRRMLLKARHIRVAVSSQLMVDPTRRSSPAAFQLQHKFLSGPQELSLTDGANDLGHKLWEIGGGRTSLLYSMHWTRILRPAQFAVSELSRRKGLSLLRMLKPVSLVLDAAERLLPQSPLRLECQDPEEDLTEKTLLECLSDFITRQSLRPAYDEYSLKWLLDMASRKESHGTLHKMVIRTPQGSIAGWCLYYIKPSGVSQVLQVWGKNSHIATVLDHVFYHARRRGSIAVSGRMEPALAEALWQRRCVFGLPGPWFLYHSRQPDILQAIESGDAFLTRLEGEWWMRFHEKTTH